MRLVGSGTFWKVRVQPTPFCLRNYEKKMHSTTKKNPTTRNRTRDLEISTIKYYSLPLYQLSYSRMLLVSVVGKIPLFTCYIFIIHRKLKRKLKKPLFLLLVNKKIKSLPFPSLFNKESLRKRSSQRKNQFVFFGFRTSLKTEC